MTMNFYKYKFVFTGGGTGGHIMPLLATKQNLSEYDTEILYIGEKGGREEAMAKREGMKFAGILAGKWRRYYSAESTTQNIIGLFKTALGFFQALWMLGKFHPKAIFAKGGYVSLPVVLAGKLLNIPIMVHESDMVVGATNKIAFTMANTILTGFPLNFYDFSKLANIKARKVYTGIPLENDFYESQISSEDYHFFHFEKDKPVLLITGGIQGAHKINKLIEGILEKLLKDWQIVHLSGETDYPRFKQIKEKLEKNKKHYALFSTLGIERVFAMRIADCIITRGSATTLAEISLMGKPAIIIPLTNAAGDHQNKNAQFYKKAGAAIVLDEDKITDDELLIEINGLHKDKSEKEAMSKKMASIAKVEAGRLISEELLRLSRE